MNYSQQDSILVTVKKMLGIDDNYTEYDMDIITFINGALMNLNQLGVGPKDGFVVYDYSQTWHQLLDGNEVNLEAAKMYVSLKVRTMFDPPTSSFVMDSYNRQITECEHRLIMQAESVKKFDFMKDKTEEYGGALSEIRF